MYFMYCLYNPLICIDCSIFILDQYFDYLMAEKAAEIKIGLDRIKDKSSSSSSL